MGRAQCIGISSAWLVLPGNPTLAAGPKQASEQVAEPFVRNGPSVWFVW